MQQSLGSTERYKRHQTRYLDTCLLLTAICYTNALLKHHHHETNNNNNNNSRNNNRNMLNNSFWKPDMRFIHCQQTTRFGTEKPPKLFKLRLFLSPILCAASCGTSKCCSWSLNVASPEICKMSSWHKRHAKCVSNCMEWNKKETQRKV